MSKKQFARKKESQHTTPCTIFKKSMNTLPQYVQHISEKIYHSAVKQYQYPVKRKEGKKQHSEVAYRTIWETDEKIWFTNHSQWGSGIQQVGME